MLPTYYDYRLVAVSVFIAICAAYAALGLAGRVRAAEATAKVFWIGGGACAMGAAIWSMHYIGMLAFQLPMRVRYNVPLVLISLLAAVLSSAIAFVFTSRDTPRRGELLLSSVVMGGGIATMHYIGMAAMRMRCVCVYDWRIVALSVVIAIVVSGVALASLRSESRFAGWHQFAAAVLLGAAVCSMHYTGMAAAHFWRSNGTVDFSDTIAVGWLGGIGIAAGTLLLIGIALGSVFADKYLSAQSLRLQSTEERYHLLFERSLAAIYRSTVDGKVIDMNDACVELLGYRSRNEVLGEVIRHLHMSEEDGKTYVDTVVQTKRLPARETRLYRTDGSIVWTLHSATLIESRDGAPPEIQGMLLSIDQLKHSEDELRSAKHAAESASRAKSQFLANMSHELRTPLNGILGMIQVLHESGLSQEQQEYVHVVKSSAESLLAVINHVLAFSTTCADGCGSAGEAFDIRELTAAEIAAFSNLAERKHLKLTFEVAPEVYSRFWGEAQWIRQILSSLLSNAVKFTPSGEIAVSVDACGQSGPNQILRIRVRDTGIGIALHQQKMIFDPFYQVDNSSTRRFGGTGLGLAIVRSLAEAMGGQISLESEAGRGSTFTLLLPLTAHRDSISIPQESADRTGERAAVESLPEAALRV